ncbi:MAG: hypothetical protein ACTSO9_03730 [Candidatus Helarchaeota archaeon]
MEGIFLDTDILFYIYAISEKKLKSWQTKKDTGDLNLNFSLELLESIEQKNGN